MSKGLKKSPGLLFSVFHLMSPFLHVSMSLSPFSVLHLHVSRVPQTENGNFRLFATNGKRKRQTSSCLLKTETENRSLISLVSKRYAVIYHCCFSKRTIYAKLVYTRIYSIYRMFSRNEEILNFFLDVRNALRETMNFVFYFLKKTWKGIQLHYWSTALISTFEEGIRTNEIPLAIPPPPSIEMGTS